MFALATLAAAGTAFAQSSVSITGILDASYHTISGNGTNATSKLNSVGASVGSATSAINFNVLEDLGGGLRAQAFYAFDPRGSFNNSATAIGRHEAYVGLSGGFGNIRLGSINTASLTVNGVGGPFGTATGSAFADIQTVAGGGVRFNNSVRYDAPTFVKGLSANVTYAPGNKDATSGGATPAVTDVGLGYTNGPLNVSFSSLSRSATVAQAYAAANTTDDTTANTVGAEDVAAVGKTTFNSIAANYTMGALRVMGGIGKGDMGSAATDTDLMRVGASYTMGAVALHAQYSTLEVGNAANNKRKATGLRADYALSKRTTTYVGYEAYDSGAGTATTKRNTAMVGVRHNF